MSGKDKLQSVFSNGIKSAKSNDVYHIMSHGLKSVKSHAFNTDIDDTKSKIRDVHEHVQIDANIIKDDDDLLRAHGYTPELSRKFGNTFSIAFSIMSLLPSIASVLGQSYSANSAVWGWFISSSLIFCIGLCMSELASAIPTSGGLYYWTYHYAPDWLRIPLSFVVGNTNTVALTGALCSIDYGFAKEILSIVYIAKDGDFDISNGIVYGIFAACVISHVISACAASGAISKLQNFSVICNIVLAIFFIIALPIATKHKNSAKFIFAETINSTTWPDGWSWVMNGFMPAVWTIGAFDSCVHCSEEVKNASIHVPIGILGSISACWFLGFVILIVCSLCINPDLNSVINTDSGQPMAQLIYDSMGKKWTLCFMVLIAFCQWLMGASTIIAISRQIWAFSRDNGLIFSSVVKVVNKRLKVPLRATYFGGVLALVMGLLCLIGPTAANALFTLCICGNYFAWQTPIMLRLYREFSKDPTLRFKPGPFYLGVFSLPVNILTVLFTNFVIIMAMFPSSKSVNSETMNYTVVITCGTWIISLVYFYAYAHKTYKGPRRTVEDQELEESSIEGENIDRIIASEKEKY